MPKDNYKLKPFARDLRKEMTDAEKRLWSRIRRKQLDDFQFYRQKIIGGYIVDFYCPQAKLVVELDGGQHYEEDGEDADKIRDNYMKRRGLQVLRFSNADVFKNIDGVLEEIWKYLESPPPPLINKGGTASPPSHIGGTASPP